MSDVLFQSGDITVTRSVAKFGNATYPIANIGSVIVESETSIAGALIIAGIVIGILVGLKTNWGFGLTSFAVLFFLSAKAPSKRKLTLKTSSGDVTALSSHDANLVESVRQAIENAFTR
jgi:hypothetical protein